MRSIYFIKSAIYVSLILSVIFLSSCNTVVHRNTVPRMQWCYLVDVVKMEDPRIVEIDGVRYVMEKRDVNSYDDFRKSLKYKDHYVYSRWGITYDLDIKLRFYSWDYHCASTQDVKFVKIKQIGNCTLYKFETNPKYFQMALINITHYNKIYSCIDCGYRNYIKSDLPNTYIRILYPVFE